ncbi:F0F1 ATP synthase subunit B [Defluviitalea raffinosedens]|uniref:ATP synthase subunit b n=2 Tax=Defluviitalea raffinosedens TaxID=1450156 RepID=A0A7C8LLI1_9FIRM|nr:F0F1 ATP synthase subunit B [Defluviitalea raffinosedens]
MKGISPSFHMKESMILLEGQGWRKEDLLLGGSLLSFDKQFLFSLGFQLINTLILFFILAKLLFKPLRNFMQKRTERIQSQLEQAKAEEEKALKLKAEYESKLQDIKKEADAILKEAREKALKQESSIIEQARQESETIRNRALADIEREKAKVTDEMKREIIEVASLMAGKFIASSIDSEKHNDLINEVIEQMGDVSWHN